MTASNSKRWPKPLAQAHQDVRDLRNKLHLLQGVDAARLAAEQRAAMGDAEIERLRRRIGEMEAADRLRRTRRPLSDAELVAASALVLREHGPRTPAFEVLWDEMDRRGLTGTTAPV